MAEWIKEKVTGRKALVTRETVKNASLRFYYDATKMQQATKLQATPISEAIKQTAAYFRESKN
jgi:hypothetical protein